MDALQLVALAAPLPPHLAAVEHLHGALQLPREAAAGVVRELADVVRQLEPLRVVVQHKQTVAPLAPESAHLQELAEPDEEPRVEPLEQLIAEHLTLQHRRENFVERLEDAAHELAGWRRLRRPLAQPARSLALLVVGELDALAVQEPDPQELVALPD